VRLLAFCEAAADFRTATSLVDRVLRDEGPTWIADVVDPYPEAVREWLNDPHGKSFFDIHRLTEYTKQLGNMRVPQGYFDGKPGAPGALMARTAFHIVREMLKRGPSAGRLETVDAVLIVWDMDDQGDGRRQGLAQARAEASRWAPFRIVLGCPDPMREAWVLAGFEPASDEERARLDELRRELGFSPCEEAHRLDAKDEQAKRSAKRVVRLLTGDDAAREERCWTEPPMDRLRARGAGSGLGAFLDEVKNDLVPLFRFQTRQ